MEVVQDLLDKVASPASRAGSTVERVSKMLGANVPASVVALQLTENSRNGNTYSASEMAVLDKLYKDTKTKVGVTKKQANALIKDQQQAEKAHESPVPSATPA